MTLTGEQATFLLDIAMAQPSPMVPARYARDRDDVAKALERHGLVERHYIGGHYGAFVTRQGFDLLDALKSQLSKK